MLQKHWPAAKNLLTLLKQFLKKLMRFWPLLFAQIVPWTFLQMARNKEHFSLLALILYKKKRREKIKSDTTQQCVSPLATVGMATELLTTTSHFILNDLFILCSGRKKRRNVRWVRSFYHQTFFVSLNNWIDVYLHPSSAPCVGSGPCMFQGVLVNLDVLDHLQTHRSPASVHWNNTLWAISCLLSSALFTLVSFGSWVPSLSPWSGASWRAGDGTVSCARAKAQIQSWWSNIFQLHLHKSG